MVPNFESFGHTEDSQILSWADALQTGEQIFMKHENMNKKEMKIIYDTKEATWKSVHPSGGYDTPDRYKDTLN